MRKSLKIVLLFLSVFLFFLIACKSLGFDSDAMGIVFSCSQKQFSLDIFSKSIAHTYYPLNDQNQCQAHGLSYYRPLQQIMFSLCYALFGLQSYEYYVVSIMLHANVVAILFYVFTLFFDELVSLLLALIFAVSPSHIPSLIGLTCGIIPAYFFLALACLAWIQYIRTCKAFLYFISAFFYVCALFSYELPIVFPLIALIYLCFFNRKNIIQRTWLLWMSTVLYLGIRIGLLGGSKASYALNIKFKQMLLQIVDNWCQSIKPFWGMQDFSKGVTALVLLCFIALVIIRFITVANRRKNTLFYLIAFFIAAWPISICNGSSRYFYAAMPFLVLVLYEISQMVAAWFPTTMRRAISIILLLIPIVWGGYRAAYNLQCREQYTLKRDQAFSALTRTYAKEDEFIFLGTLYCFNNQIFLMQSGMTQAMRLFFNNPNMLVYHADEIKIYCKEFSATNFVITPIKQGYRFVSLDPKRLFIMVPYEWTKGTSVCHSMGILTVNSKISGWQADDVSYTIDSAWLQNKKRLHVLTWDIAAWKFIELDMRHLV